MDERTALCPRFGFGVEPNLMVQRYVDGVLQQQHEFTYAGLGRREYPNGVSIPEPVLACRFCAQIGTPQEWRDSLAATSGNEAEA